ATAPSAGEAWPLPKHAAAIESFRWAPDGKRIALVAAAPESKSEKDRKETYSDYEVFEEDYRQNQLWLVDVAAAEAGGQPAESRRIVTDAKVNVRDASWSPDGTRIAFSGAAGPLLSVHGTSGIYPVDLPENDRARK